MLEHFLEDIDRVAGFEGADTLIRSCALEHDAFGVQLEIRGDDGLCAGWRITALEPRGFLVSPGWIGGTPLLVSQHPVLLHCADAQSDLYFCDGPDDPTPVIGALLLCHVDAVGGWLPFETYVRIEMLREENWRVRHGKLATGPLTLLNAYASVLNQYGVRCSISSGQQPLYHSAGKWLRESRSLQALILGRHWIVAERFDAEHMDPP